MNAKYKKFKNKINGYKNIDKSDTSTDLLKNHPKNDGCNGNIKSKANANLPGNQTNNNIGNIDNSDTSTDLPKNNTKK